MSIATLLAAALWVPLALLAACLVRPLRRRMPASLAVAPLPALAVALLANPDAPPLRASLAGMALALDAPGALLLGVAALLWIAAGAFATAWLRGAANAERFSVWWLLTLAGSLGVFVVADLPGFYLFYSLVSLAAWGLVAHDDTASDRRAGAIYVAFAVLGEAFLLFGFVLLAATAPDGSLLIRDGVAALPASPWRDATLACLILGFVLKIGLVPGHGWMPLAYAAAPFPAAAVLSGAAVKAGVIGLIRFLPFDAALPGAGHVLAAAGLLSAFYGVAIGITQANPKAVLAYSSVSQMGFLAAVLGMGLAAGDPGTVSDASFYAAHHVLVKGALFLALGVVAATGASRSPWVLWPAGVIALSLAGLPLSGGALAKWAAKGPLGDGVVAGFATLSAAGSTLLILHFLGRLAATDTAAPKAVAPSGLAAPWLATAAAAVVVPWALFATATGGDWREVLAPAALAKATWPILLGVGLFAALRRWGHALPRVPEGDVLVAGAGALRIARACGAALERLDTRLRSWPVAGVSLLAIAIALGAALLAGR